MSPALAEALSCHGGVATVAELVAAGVPRTACRWAAAHGDLVAVHRGVVADPQVWGGLDARERHVAVVRAVLSRGRAGAVATGRSAAAVWGLPVDQLVSTPMVVAARTERRPEHGERSGSVVRRRSWLADCDITEVAGVPVTTLVRTVVDVAREEPVPWGLAVADAAAARGLPRDMVAAAVKARAPIPGSRRAAVVADWADPRAESPLESVARATILLLGLPVPELQVWLSRGGVRYRVDLLVREHRTIVEVDGKVKYDDAGGAETVWAEKRRRDDLLSWGFEVERFVASDAHRPVRWGRKLLHSFRRAAARHGMPEVRVDPAFPAYAKWPRAWLLDGR